MKKAVIESILPFISGMFGYMLKRWLGDVTTNKLIKPLINIMKKKLIKTENDLIAYWHGYNAYLNDKDKAGD
jgi:hypothetical protein